MSISEEEHDIISSLTKNLAVSIVNMMEYTKMFGYEVAIPDHFCAYENNDVEELVIRMSDCSISVKVTLEATDYAEDKYVEDALGDVNLERRVDETIQQILRESGTNEGK